MPRIEPTAEQLQHAFSAVRLPSWPSTYSEAAHDAVRQRLVRAAAVRLALGLGVTRASSAQRPAALRSTPTAPPTATNTIDRKRLAAGDRDD